MAIESAERNQSLERQLEGIKDAGMREWAQEGLRREVVSEEELQSSTLPEKYRQWLTAVHEVGHGLAARFYGWQVLKESVIRQGNTLGVTEVRADTGVSWPRLVRERVSIGWSGFVARAIVGHGNPAEGTGADFAQIRALSGGNLAGRSEAFGAVGSYGRSRIIDRSWRLYKEKILVGT